MSFQREIWEQQLRSSLGEGWFVQCFDEVTSTMDVARELIQSGASGLRPALILANRQRSGRGRHGRAWIGASEAYLATYIFPITTSLEKLSGLSLVVGLVLVEELSRYGITLKVKWPNDVLSIDGRKVSGTLIDIVSRVGGSSCLIGIGINIAGEPEGAASLKSLGAPATLDPSTLACELSQPLLAAAQQAALSGFEPFKKRWEDRAALIGEKIRLDTGDRVIEGTFHGVDAQGALLLNRGDVVERLLSARSVRVIG